MELTIDVNKRAVVVLFVDLKSMPSNTQTLRCKVIDIADLSSNFCGALRGRLLVTDNFLHTQMQKTHFRSFIRARHCCFVITNSFCFCFFVFSYFFHTLRANPVVSDNDAEAQREVARVAESGE